MENNENGYIGTRFSVGGLAYTVTESKLCSSSGERIFIATNSIRPNMIWGGTLDDLNEATRNWVAVVSWGNNK